MHRESTSRRSSASSDDNSLLRPAVNVDVGTRKRAPNLSIPMRFRPWLHASENDTSSVASESSIASSLHGLSETRSTISDVEMGNTSDAASAASSFDEEAWLGRREIKVLMKCKHTFLLNLADSLRTAAEFNREEECEAPAHWGVGAPWMTPDMEIYVANTKVHLSDIERVLAWNTRPEADIFDVTVDVEGPQKAMMNDAHFGLSFAPSSIECEV